jgi:predicted HD superfamily hydrolase involved in NAD metabolism
MKADIQRAAELVASELPAELYRHTVRTRDYALELGERFGCDERELERIELASLLHDNCKHWPAQRLLSEAKELGYAPSELERRVPALLHARVGAHRLQRDFGVTDETVYSAVYHHTVGGRAMGREARIVFCADKLEPGRDYAGVEELRARAADGLNELCLTVIASGLDYLTRKRTPVDRATLDFYNELVMEQSVG